MIKRLLALLIVALSFIPSGTLADSNRVTDRSAHDSNGPIDIEWVKHAHDGRKLVHVISTYDRWRNSELGDNLFQINFSPGDGSPSVRRILIISLHGSELRAKMMNMDNGGEVMGYPPVTRPTARAVKVTFPKRWIRQGAEAFRWHALVANRQVDDWVPSENGFILHRM